MKCKTRKRKKESKDNVNQLSIADITLVSKNKTIAELKKEMVDIINDRSIKSYLNFVSKENLVKNIASRYSSGEDGEDSGESGEDSGEEDFIINNTYKPAYIG